MVDPTKNLGDPEAPLSAAGSGRVKPRPRRYSRRFKLRAVRLVVEEKLSIAQVARELGISRSSLGRWKRDLRDAVTPRRPPELEPAPVRDDRQAILARHIGELEASFRKSGGTKQTHPTLRGLALDHWERALLQGAFAPAGERSYLAYLIAQGTALQIKVKDDIDRLEKGEPLFEELIADAAVGLALIEETQQATDQLIRVGQMSQAKRLTGFRTKIRQPIFRLVDRIGREGLERAQAISGTMITEVPADDFAVPDKVATPPAPRRRCPAKRPPVQPPEQVDRRRPLLIALAASLFAALLIVLPQLETASAPAEVSGAAARDATVRLPLVRPAGIAPEVSPVGRQSISLPERRRLLRQIDAAASDSPEALSGGPREVGR